MDDQEQDRENARAEIAIDLPRYLPYRIHKIASLIASPAPVELGDGIDLSTRAWRAMMVLAANGALTIGEISRAIAADMASTTRAVRSLEERSLILRSSPDGDRRKQIITLSGEGAAVHDRIARRRLEEERDLMTALTPEDRDRLFGILDRIEAKLSGHGSD